MITAVSVQDLTKTYESGATAVHALDSVSLDVESGEVMMLMGPSGSGKTTLLSIMGCILRPTSGSVKIRGREIAGLGEKELPRVRLENIGFIFQGFNLFPTLTAGENVELAMDLKNIRGRQARLRAGELLEQVNLSDKYESYPADLSGGQKQRVAIARALAGEPEIILADEPTAALDSISGRVVMKLLRDLAHERGRAIVTVTHDNRALDFADRIVRIEDGKIIESLLADMAQVAIDLIAERSAKRFVQRLMKENFMNRKLAYSVALFAIVGLAAAFFLAGKGRTSPTGAVVKADSEPMALVAAPGRVEPVSEEINISSELRGKLRSVMVEEGDRVQQGQAIAVLVNDDYRAAVASAEAQLKQKEAELRRVVNGARNQERREAWQGVKEAEAMLENARAEMERRQSLYAKGVIAREEVDRADREYKVAKARFDAAGERHALVDDAAREEDRSKAEADVALARAQIDEARARFEKTFIRSPINGIVLRKHLKSGESVSDMRDMPIVTVADVATLRVRVDVDETDVSRIEMNQQAYVTADAFGDKKFWGRVIRIGQVLGKKNVRTDEPSERVDTKILETLIELDGGQYLPAGLRVDSFIITGKSLPVAQ